MKIYTYKNCGSCKKATKWLSEKGIQFEEIAIRETPPTEKELSWMLAQQENKLGKLFNTSGRDYREQGLKDKLPELSSEDAFALLQSNGNLVKRPFVVAEQGGLVGFKESVWEETLLG